MARPTYIATILPVAPYATSAPDVTVAVSEYAASVDVVVGLVDDLDAAKPDQTGVEAAVATLEADAASPTEAHVDALRGQWDTFVTAANGLNTLIDAAILAADALDVAPVDASVASDVTLLFNADTVVTRYQLTVALRAIQEVLKGSNVLTE